MSAPSIRDRLLWLTISIVVVAVRLLVPPRGMDAAGLSAPLDSLISISFWLLIISIAAGLGLLILKFVSLTGLSGPEILTFGFALGLGTLSYMLVALGFLGLLQLTTITLLIVVLGFGAAPYAQPVWIMAPRRVLAWWRDGSALLRTFLVLASAIALLAFVHALSPPWDYDGLMYHLPGPLLFLENSSIVPDFDNWYVNGPFTVEMLFSIGLAFGDDVVPKLIHYATGLLYVSAAVVFARRWLKAEDGWLSAGVLLSMPTLPIWAAFAYIDLGWASFEFLGMFAVMIGWQSKDRKFFALGGALTGLAMGSKYLGLMGFAVLGIFVVLIHLRSGRRSLVASTLAFAAPALLLASPWYLKNLIWFGNPVYPLYLGGPGWDATRLTLYTSYLQTFGTGRTISDFITIPWNIYAQNSRFGAVMNQIDIPSFLFPLLLIYPVWKRSRVVSVALLIAAGRSVLWAMGSLQTRFLLPVFPALAVGTAFVANRLFSRLQGRFPWRIFLPTLILGLTALTLFYQFVVITQFAPHLPTLGLETRRQFIARIVRDYPAVEFISSNLSPDSRTLFIGDGRSYYCPTRCVPDPDHFRWAREISELSGDQELKRWFANNSFSHVLLSVEDLDFLLQHDPLGVMHQALNSILDWRDEGCLVTVFEDEWTRVFEVICQ